MNTLTLSIVSAILMGLGATLTFDLWGLFLKLAFKIAPSNICLVGRWVRYMPTGIFKHANIASVPPKSAECLIGWITHYTIGITLASMFVAIMGNRWLQQPTLLPASGFGAITVLAPFFIMQPAMGLGFAASKTPHPAQARLRSLTNHLAFGAGLYFFAVLLNHVFLIYA